MKKIKVFKPFTGGSTHGFGTIRKKTPAETNIHKYVFESESGDIYFDNVTDNQIKGVLIVEELTNDSLRLIFS